MGAFLVASRNLRIHFDRYFLHTVLRALGICPLHSVNCNGPFNSYIGDLAPAKLVDYVLGRWHELRSTVTGSAKVLLMDAAGVIHHVCPRVIKHRLPACQVVPQKHNRIQNQRLL